MIPLAIAIPGVPKFLVSWLIGQAISFVIRQVDKWEETIDWTKVKADLKIRVESLIPGQFLDEEGVELVNRVVDKLAAALADTVALRKILEASAKGDWGAAFEALKDLVLAQAGFAMAEGLDPEQAVAARDEAFLKALTV